MNEILNYSPVIVVVVAVLLQQRMFVTPEQLEKKHREIIDEAQSRFASTHSVILLKEQLVDMKEKVDKIYDFIINN